MRGHWAGGGWLQQAAKFGGVGLVATMVHAVLYWLLVRFAWGDEGAYLANAAAFGTAFLVSFAGHHLWTFARPGPRRGAVLRLRMLRFAGVALAGFILNNGWVFLLADLASLPAEYGVIPMLLLTPPCTFLLSRCWAFR